MSDSNNAAASATDASATDAQAPKVVTYTSLKPKIFVEAPNAGHAVEFYKVAFGAVELLRCTETKRKADQEQLMLNSVLLRIGNFSFLVADLTDDVIRLARPVLKGSVICLETDEVEAAIARAIEAGAVPEGDEASGEVMGNLKDPFGNLWIICPQTNQAPDVAQAPLLL